LLIGVGSRAVDMGCGDGRFTRELADLCCDVTGIDINNRKLDQARAAMAAARLPIKFRNAHAESMPFSDRSLDLVAFSNSLHHISDMGAALREAARILVPDGLLYVMEPVPAGNYHEATKLLRDETAVRTEAYRVTTRSTSFGFIPLVEISFRTRCCFSSYDEWRSEQIERDIKRGAVFESKGDEVRARFEANADRTNGFAFDQVFRVNLLRRASSDHEIG
jgi:SAM-dependent methyltransferase